MERLVEYYVEDGDHTSRLIDLDKEDCGILDDDLSNDNEFDLLLPEPNPLIKRAKPIPEPLKIVYKYPFKKLGKFDGKDKIDIHENNEDCVNYDYKTKRNSGLIESNIEYEKLEKYFFEEEKIVYKRVESSLSDTFNNNYLNLKKYFKKRDEKSTAGLSPSKLIKKSSKNIIKPVEDQTNNTNSNNNNANKLAQDESDINGNTNNNTNNNNKYQDYYYQLKALDDKTLVFESRFESGNLSMVSKISDNEYNLILQNDINTNGYIQWFFFEVNNTTKAMNVKFNIINFIKSDSIFNHGMKILIYSRKEYQSKKIGWFRGGKNISYYKNNILRSNKNLNKIQTYKTLTFEYEFNHNDDQVYFAYSYPYTYSDLMEYIDQLDDDPEISKIIVRAPLCRTIAGNVCEVLTISNHPRPDHIHKKKCILLISRVHPGEPVSSYTIKGVIDFLTSKKEEANALRENFIFKIIPMLNPDGVIHGNYRCDLAGCDLNRRWRKPLNHIHPTIVAARRLIENIKDKYSIGMFCDFHGHSRKFNTFLYACSEPKHPYKSREFPFIMSRICQFFSFYDCSFIAHPYKKRTARVTVFEEFKASASFCLETSFFGSSKTKKHFSREDLEMIGHKFCESLIIYFCINPKNPLALPKKHQMDNTNSNKANNGFDQITVENYNQIQLKRQLLEELYANEENLSFGTKDILSDSDSEASDDGLSKDLLAKFVSDVNKNKPAKKQEINLSSSISMNYENHKKNYNNKIIYKKKYQPPDMFKNSFYIKDTKDNDKIPYPKMNSSASPTKFLKNIDDNIHNNTTNQANIIYPPNNESPKKQLYTNNTTYLKKSLSEKYDKLPNISIQEFTLNNMYNNNNNYGRIHDFKHENNHKKYSERNDAGNNDKLIKKAMMIYNYNDLLQAAAATTTTTTTTTAIATAAINSTPIIITSSIINNGNNHNNASMIHNEMIPLYNELEPHKMDMIASSSITTTTTTTTTATAAYLKKIKTNMMDKEALTPKDFICDFKCVQQLSYSPYVQQTHKKKNWKLYALKKIGVDAKDHKDFKNQSHHHHHHHQQQQQQQQQQTQQHHHRKSVSSLPKCNIYQQQQQNQPIKHMSYDNEDKIIYKNYSQSEKFDYQANLSSDDYCLDNNNYASNIGNGINSNGNSGYDNLSIITNNGFEIKSTQIPKNESRLININPQLQNYKKSTVESFGNLSNRDVAIERTQDLSHQYSIANKQNSLYKQADIISFIESKTQLNKIFPNIQNKGKTNGFDNGTNGYIKPKFFNENKKT